MTDIPWFEWKWVHMFEHLVPSWWKCLGRIRRCVSGGGLGGFKSPSDRWAVCLTDCLNLFFLSLLPPHPAFCLWIRMNVLNYCSSAMSACLSTTAPVPRLPVIPLPDMRVRDSPSEIVIKPPIKCLFHHVVLVMVFLRSNRTVTKTLYNEILHSCKQKINLEGKWNELENILSKMTQTQKDNHHMFSVMTTWI